MTIQNIEAKIYESVKAINEIATKDSYNKTDCLNAQYQSGRIHACLDMLESIDFDRFVAVHEDIKNTMQLALEIIDKIYR